MHGYSIIPDILVILFLLALEDSFSKKSKSVDKTETVTPVKPKSRFWYYQDRTGKVHTEIRQ